MKIQKASLADLLALHEQGKLVGPFETSSEDYHNAPGISNTTLGDVAQAPAVYDYNRKNPVEETDAMLGGRVLHVLVIQPEKFGESFAVAPPEVKQRRGQAWDKAVLENQGKTVLKAEDGEASYARAKMIADAARASKRFALLEGIKEISFFWKDPATGLLCKCRPDVITLKGVVTDYKTTAGAAHPKEAWGRHMFSMRYHVQAAFYIDGIVHSLEQAGMPLDAFPMPKAFAHFVQEKSPPFLTKHYKVGDASVSLGRREYQKNLQTIKECEAKGEFPGYPEAVEEVECPEYAWTQELNDDGE